MFWRMFDEKIERQQRTAAESRIDGQDFLNNPSGMASKSHFYTDVQLIF